MILMLNDKTYELSPEEAYKLEAKLKRMRVSKLSEEDIEREVGNILSAMQDAEYNYNKNVFQPVYHNLNSGYTYVSYSYILEELRKIYPPMSSKRLTKILANMGLEAPWDTNRRIYTGRSYRWIKL